MTLYNLTCPKCGNAFQFDYNRLHSFSEYGIVIRLGEHAFSVKCPVCNKRSTYHVSDLDKVVNILEFK